MNYDGLKDMLCRELEDIQHKELSSNNLDVMYKAVDIIKDIETIKAMENGYSNGYSGENSGMFRPWYAYDGRSYDSSYDGSYDGRGRGRYAERDSMGRYSGNYSRNSEEEIRRIMDRTSDEREREILKRALDSMKER